MRWATSTSTSVSAWVGESGPTSASPIAPTSAVAVKAGSCAGSSPRATPSAIGGREDVGVGAAELQPLGLDGGIDGLGEQRPRQPPAMQRAAGEGVDGRDEPLLRGLAARLGDRIDLVLGGDPEDLGQQVGLRGEVAVDRAGGHARALGDRGDLRLAVAALRDQRQRGAHDLLARLRAAGLGALGGAIGHRVVKK